MPEAWGSFDEPLKGRDCRIIARAVKEKWPLPPEIRAKIVSRLIELSHSRRERDRHSAVATLILMDEIDALGAPQNDGTESISEAEN